jgi:uncharacterized membrane protein YccC
MIISDRIDSGGRRGVRRSQDKGRLPPGISDRDHSGVSHIKDDDHPLRFVGLPLNAWSFALRTWIAMMAALYAAFWLQLGSASSAAVCVGILALPTRGQAYDKAFYRLVGTFVGVVASIVISGLFNGVRDLFILTFAGWMALCVYVASLLDGSRAYGAVLSGYTVAFVAVADIDTPQDVFSAGIDRGAAILIGIAALMVFNDAFAAPDAFPGLLSRLEAAHRRVVTFTQRVLRDGQAAPQDLTNLLKTIVGFRTDISSLPTESVAGQARAAAARSAVAAMAREVAASCAAGVVVHDLGMEARDLAYALSAFLNQPSATRAEALDRQIDRIIDTRRCAGSLFVVASSARVVIDQNRRTLAALRNLWTDGVAPHAPRLPLFRAPEAALRNALRVFLAMLMGAGVLITTGWPSTSFTMMLLGATAALSATAPNPESFAKAALIAMPTAFALAGITNFLLLGGADAFPLLALGMAPAIIGAGLLVACGNPKLAPIGTFLLVFTPLLLSPSNPENYDPQTYLVRGTLAVLAVVALFVVLGTVLPTTDARKRAWILRSLRTDFRRALRESRLRCDPDALAFRDADRLSQLGDLKPELPEDHATDLHNAFYLAALNSAAWQVRLALDDPQIPSSAEREGRAALAAEDPDVLRRAADRLLAVQGETTGRDRKVRRWAAATLVWMATLVERSPREIAALNKEWADDP